MASFNIEDIFKLQGPLYILQDPQWSFINLHPTSPTLTTESWSSKTSHTLAVWPYRACSRSYVAPVQSESDQSDSGSAVSESAWIFHRRRLRSSDTDAMRCLPAWKAMEKITPWGEDQTENKYLIDILSKQKHGSTCTRVQSMSSNGINTYRLTWLGYRLSFMSLGHIQ